MIINHQMDDYHTDVENWAKGQGTCHYRSRMSQPDPFKKRTERFLRPAGFSARPRSSQAGSDASAASVEQVCQLIDALASPHALYRHALELPGISLSSLHSCFLSRKVCPSRVGQFKRSFQPLPSKPLPRPMLLGKGRGSAKLSGPPIH